MCWPLNLYMVRKIRVLPEKYVGFVTCDNS